MLALDIPQSLLAMSQTSLCYAYGQLCYAYGSYDYCSQYALKHPISKSKSNLIAFQSLNFIAN